MHALESNLERVEVQRAVRASINGRAALRLLLRLLHQLLEAVPRRFASGGVAAQTKDSLASQMSHTRRLMQLQRRFGSSRDTALSLTLSLPERRAAAGAPLLPSVDASGLQALTGMALIATTVFWRARARRRMRRRGLHGVSRVLAVVRQQQDAQVDRSAMTASS